MKKVSMDAYEYAKFLKQQKIKELGSGCFGTVYQHPTMKDVVVKVAEDEAYEAWVRFCKKHQGNPLVPVIYHHEKFVGPDNSPYTITILEKLKRIPWPEERGGKWMERLTKAGLEVVNKSTFKVRKMKAHNEHAEVVVEGIARLKRRGFYVDLHNENVMLRGKQVVITDPIVP